MNSRRFLPAPGRGSDHPIGPNEHFEGAETGNKKQGAANFAVGSMTEVKGRAMRQPGFLDRHLQI
jgi:hypothetical protein